MKKYLAVIIPMYNEAPNAKRCIEEMCRVLFDLQGVSLFVVNDGSKDQTKEICLDVIAKNPDWPVEFVDQQPNQGYGAACLAGARAAHKAGFTFGLFMDSDLTNDPKLIKNFLDVLQTDQYDFVKASRYRPGGGMQGVPMYRQRYTIWGNRLASLLFGMDIKDCTNGFRAVRLSMLDNVTFREKGFPSILEELYILKKKGARGTEIPYVLTSRAEEGGESKFSYRYTVLWSYLKYAILARLVAFKENQNGPTI